MCICIYYIHIHIYFETKTLKFLPTLESSLQEHLLVQCHKESATCISICIYRAREERYLYIHFAKQPMKIAPQFGIVPPRAFASAVPNRVSHMYIRIQSERGEIYVYMHFSKQNIHIPSHFGIVPPRNLLMQCQIYRVSHMYIRIYIERERREIFVYAFSNNNINKNIHSLESSL